MIKYINSQTNKEVKYGETLTYREEKKLSGGHILTQEVTLPIINDTIPDLIKKGILVQKEVKDNCKCSGQKNKESENLDIHKKLDLLALSMISLRDRVEIILKLLKE